MEEEWAVMAAVVPVDTAVDLPAAGAVLAAAE